MTLAVNIAQGGSNNVTMRNRIINGAMVIDQRNAGASVTVSSTSALTYGVDRWFGYGNVASKFSIQQNAGSVTPPAGYVNYFGATSSSAYSVGSGDYFVLGQKIEGYNIADLGFGTANAKTITLSFQVYSSLTGTFGGAVCNGAQTRSYPFTFTISSANTWTPITVTIAGDTGGTWVSTNAAGLNLWFGLGEGSTWTGTAGSWSSNDYRGATGAVSVVGTNGATFYITGVQLEAGTTASPFEYRQYGTELMLCQRYYYKATTGTLFNQIAFCNVRTTTSHYAFLQIPVTLRANPSSVDYSGIGVISAWGAGVTGLTSLSFANAAYGTGQTQVLLDAVTSGAVGTVGQISMLLGNNSTTGYVALNAEL
jgi:hypothetical protein